MFGASRAFFCFQPHHPDFLGAGIVILLANGNALQAEFLGATLPLV